MLRTKGVCPLFHYGRFLECCSFIKTVHRTILIRQAHLARGRPKPKAAGRALRTCLISAPNSSTASKRLTLAALSYFQEKSTSLFRVRDHEGDQFFTMKKALPHIMALAVGNDELHGASEVRVA